MKAAADDSNFCELLLIISILIYINTDLHFFFSFLIDTTTTLFFHSVSIRKTAKGDIFKTNSGNVIYDCQITDNVKVSGLDVDLSKVPGVITTGLFVDFIDILITIKNESVIEIETAGEVFW